MKEKQVESTLHRTAIRAGDIIRFEIDGMTTFGTVWHVANRGTVAFVGAPPHHPVEMPNIVTVVGFDSAPFEKPVQITEEP